MIKYLYFIDAPPVPSVPELNVTGKILISHISGKMAWQYRQEMVKDSVCYVLKLYRINNYGIILKYYILLVLVFKTLKFG